MVRLREYLTEQENQAENLVCEMSRFNKEDTGLPVHIWIDDVGFERNVSHNLPRLKFQKTKKDSFVRSELIPMSIEKHPRILVKTKLPELSSKDIEKIKKWIKLNHDDLIKLWNGTMSVKQFVPRMKMV
jgi:hypothetical protein